jgi:hypothetical protein
MPGIMFHLTEEEIQKNVGAKRIDDALKAASKAAAENVVLSKFGKKRSFNIK